MARGLAALALLLVIAGARAADEDVVTVSGGLKQLEELVKKHPNLVVEFYAPWCGHCKKLEPEWAKAATALKGNDPPIVMAKLDATDKANEEAKTKFGIQGFPTIKFFRGDISNPGPYDGPREEAGIVKYLKKQVMPAYSKLESADAVKKARADSEVLVLAYLEKEGSPEFKTFETVANALRNDMDFAFVTDHKLVEECTKDCKSPFVLMSKAGEAEQPRYEGEFKPALLQAWASSKSLPLVIKFGNPSAMKHIQKAFGGNSPRLVAVGPDTPELQEQLQQASKASDSLSVIFATEADKRLVDYYGLKPAGTTVLLIEDPKVAAKYLKKDAKPSDVPEFVRQFTEGALERWLKSEEPPADNNGPVKVLTGKTFEDEVFKGGRDMFIEFYAPWCGHCKKLAPIWDEIGEELKGDDGLVIAKMDATLNDIPTPKISVRGYPTLFFVTAGGEVIQHSGGRTKEDLLKYIAEKRTTKAAAAAAAAGGAKKKGHDEL